MSNTTKNTTNNNPIIKEVAHAIRRRRAALGRSLGITNLAELRRFVLMPTSSVQKLRRAGKNNSEIALALGTTPKEVAQREADMMKGKNLAFRGKLTTSLVHEA